MRTPFDVALQNQELDLAREIYALKHGAPGTSAYLVAWLRFSRRIRTVDDLRAARRAATLRDQTRTRKNGDHGSSPPSHQAAQRAAEHEQPSRPDLPSINAAESAPPRQPRAVVTS